MKTYNLLQMRDATEHLQSLLDALIDAKSGVFEELLERLTLAKRALYLNFADLAKERYGSRRHVKDAKAAVVQHICSMFPDQIEAADVLIPGFIKIHEILLAYLIDRVGQSVPAAELRALTGDQIHAERRVRQFRDIGFLVEWRKETGDFKYVLRSRQQNLDHAAAYWMSKRLSRPFRDQDLAQLMKSRLTDLMARAESRL